MKSDKLQGFGKRKAIDRLMTVLSFLCVLVALVPLISMLLTVVTKGVLALNLDFLTQLPKAVGESGGGFGNAIQGTFIVVGIACLISLPIGIFSGVFLSEYGANSIALGVRFISDVLSGTPSIIAGIFSYTLVVKSFGSWSALAGGFALSLIMIPIITRTVEESLRLVPLEVREASLALGIRRWRTILNIVMITAKAGIITGIILATARASGEAAPLLFTSGFSNYWASSLTNQPVSTLPVMIYTYAISPFEDWRAKAWAGALVLMILILILNVGMRFATKGKYSWRNF